MPYVQTRKKRRPVALSGPRWVLGAAGDEPYVRPNISDVRSPTSTNSDVRSPTRTSTEVRSPTSTSTEVRSPTSTSTEVRSPTSTSTDAYTQGNITVTGGAGAGATTSVNVYPCGSQIAPATMAGKAKAREQQMMAQAARTGWDRTGASAREREMMAQAWRTGQAPGASAREFQMMAQAARAGLAGIADLPGVAVATAKAHPILSAVGAYIAYRLFLK